MTKPAEPVKFSQPESFEAALAELENIVLEMEAGQMTLEDVAISSQTGYGIATILSGYVTGCATTGASSGG